MVKNLIPWRKKPHEVEVLKQYDDPTFDLTRGMADMVNRLFRRFDDDLGGSLLRSEFGFGSLPSVDISETDSEIIVSADLPGLEEKNIQVTLDNDVLILKGERKHEHKEKKKNYHRIEKAYGVFHRSVTLPEGIDRDNVKATFKNGVLNVTIGKVPGAKPSHRRIPVENR